jgi:hypothetical protein
MRGEKTEIKKKKQERNRKKGPSTALLLYI